MILFKRKKNDTFDRTNSNERKKVKKPFITFMEHPFEAKILK